ncbi:MAG: hypothetical protein LKG27_06835 [Clostridiaceae bacterium]|jgi:CO dehydrogenase/acetyl-CoA synthase gamma subunit (corrinoid Fe-S protein)|nr:hypothetical protein [Clostridiaceae bacterium]
MSDISGLQIFKYLPAAKKEEHSNCKECGCPTCMAYALKLAKKQLSIDLCPYMPESLKSQLLDAIKVPQKTVEISGLKVGGENVMFRHEKTFVNPTALTVILDTDKSDWQEQLRRLENFEIKRVNDIFKIDLVIIKGNTSVNSGKLNVIKFSDFEKLPLTRIKDNNFNETKSILLNSRTKAIKEKDEKFSDPVCVYMKSAIKKEELCARASYYICKYANMLVFENFDEALFSTLMTLRQNIFTDPQKPMQVEPKVYKFNNPDENSLIFMTTNFALTFFAVANELESLKESSYLIVTPADGMSVLTAWSAEKFTAKMAVKTIKKYELDRKVKNRNIIIPGLLEHMKPELEEELRANNLDFNIVIGTVDAYKIQDFVKNLKSAK